MPVPQSYPRSLNLIFAADPFDPRFINNDAGRTMTTLGAVVNVWFWLMTHSQIVDGAVSMRATLEQAMERECPDTRKELNDYLERDQTAYV